MSGQKEDDFEFLVIRHPPMDYFLQIAHDLNSCITPIEPFFRNAFRLMKSDEPERAEKHYKRGMLQIARTRKVLSRIRDKIDPDSGEMRLRVRKVNFYRDTIAPFIDDYEPEIEERDISIDLGGEFSRGDIELNQDRGIIYYTNRTLLKNVMDCGYGTRCVISAVAPVSGLDDNEAVVGGEFALVRIDNSVSNDKIEKKGNWGMGTKIAQQNISIIGGEYPTKFLQRYNVGSELWASVRYMIPLDLKAHYQDREDLVIR